MASIAPPLETAWLSSNVELETVNCAPVAYVLIAERFIAPPEPAALLPVKAEALISPIEDSMPDMAPPPPVVLLFIKSEPVIV